MKKELIDFILEKNPHLKSVQSKLEAMKPGSFCLNRSWGFGQIKSFDESTQTLVIDFQNKKDHSMDFVFCASKLDILPDEHIVVRYHQDSVAMQNKMKDSPVDFVVDILSIFENSSASAIEIERTVSLMIGEEKAKKWWNGAKKLLIKDPRISVPSKKGDLYSLREDLISVEQEILEEFYLTKNPIKKILLAEKIHQLSNGIDQIEDDLPQILEALTLAIQESKLLTQAQRLHGCWVRNDLARHLHENPEDMEPSSGSILKEAESLSQIVNELPSAYYKRFLDLITRVFIEDWETTCLGLLKTSSGKFTSECINFLMDKDCTEAIEFSLKKWLDEQVLKAPVLFWIVKNRHAKRFQPIVRNLMNHRLLSIILYAIDNEALQNTSNKKIPLAELVTEDKDLIHDLLIDTKKEIAYDLAQILILSQGFEDLAKKSILARFIKLFPSIQKLLVTDVTRQTDQFIVSAESIEIRKKEYETLINEKIPENKKAIAIAREHGDLRENSEYKMARQDQETLLARKTQLESEIAKARVSDFKDAPIDTIAIGSVVTLEELNSTDKAYTYTILGAWDSNPSENIISYKTPLAQTLLGKKINDTVMLTINSKQQELKIQRIQRFVDIK